LLPRELRLRESRCFQSVYRRGRSWSNLRLVVHALPRGEPEKRFGFVVGKKVGGAVQRNRVRRLLREACRALASRVPWGVDVVIVGRVGAAEASLVELTADLEALFQQAGLWAEDPAARFEMPAGGMKPRSGGARRKPQGSD
jgi:ribonuclease P protein component